MHTSVDSGVPPVEPPVPPVDSAVPLPNLERLIDDPITFEWLSEFLMTMLRHWSVMVASMLLFLCAVILLVSGASVGLGIISAIGSVVLMGLCFFSNWNAPEEDFFCNLAESVWPYTEASVDPREALSVIDNRGQGDCLFLSVARGLIHLIQQEPRDNRQLLARWRALDPEVSDTIAQDMDEFDVTREAHPLLDFLQHSLRKIYVQERKEALRVLVADPSRPLVSDFHFREFERCIQIARGHDSAGRVVKYSRARDSHNTFLDLIRPFRSYEKGKEHQRRLPPDVLFKALIENNHKLFMDCIEAMQQPRRWAGDDQVLVLGRAFNVSTEIMQAEDHAQEFGRRELIDGQPLLSVVNFDGTHWMTKIVRDTVEPLLEASRLSM